ncbi:MAG: formate/nitrite transporter family protein [Lachnospiraceae bacterium]|nr:formate/nitrite transporter family protein [Lachnospiraceae bacterium]
MGIDDVKLVNNAANAKSNLLTNHPFKYFIRAIMAGFFIDMAVILCNVTNNTFAADQAWWGKLIAALLFGIAIMLIVNIGGELFTGNNMVMAFASYKKNVSWGSTWKVWGASYAGNLVGCIFFAGIFVLAGASGTQEWFAKSMETKLALSGSTLFFRAILCNFFVCCGVLCGMKMKSETGKIIMIFLCIGGFVFSGFEHVVANMGTFAVAFMLDPSLPIGTIIKDILIVTLGNIIGGAVLMAWPLRMMSADE